MEDKAFDDYYRPEPEDDSSGNDNENVKNLAAQIFEETVFKEFKNLISNLNGRYYTSSHVDFRDAYKNNRSQFLALAKDLPADKIFSVTDANSWTYFHAACRYFPEDALQILHKFSETQLHSRLKKDEEKRSPLRLALLAIDPSASTSRAFELAKQIIQHVRPQDLTTKDGEGKTDLEHIRAAKIPDHQKEILQKLYLQQLELANVDRDAAFKEFEKSMRAVGANFKKFIHHELTLFELAKKLPSSKILSVTNKSDWNYFHYICRYSPERALELLDKFSSIQIAKPTEQVSALGLTLNGMTVDAERRADFITLAKELLERTSPKDLMTAKGNGETDFERLLSSNIPDNIKFELLEIFAKKFESVEAELRQTYLDQVFKQYSEMFHKNFCWDIKVALAYQLPAEKILEPKSSDGNNVFHQTCCYFPSQALEFLDKLSPSQLYERTLKGNSPLYLVLEELEQIKDLGYFELAKEIIQRADPKDLRGDGTSRINDLYMMMGRNIPQDLIDELSSLYKERIKSQELAPVHQAPQSVKINPQESIQGLIARPDANELDALETIRTLQDSFRATVDEVARISVSSSEKVKGATGSMGALIVSINMVEKSLQELADNPERVVIRPGIAGILDRTMRACLPGVYDPLRPALQHLQNARVLASAADRESQEMLRVQITLAENHNRFKEPYAVTLESLETAVAHYQTQDDPQSQRMLRIFEGATRSMKEQIFQLERLASNTDSGRECAITTIQFARDMHDVLNALAIDIANLATQSTAQELRRVTVRGDVREGDVGLRAIFKVLTDDIKARLERQRGTAQPLLESLQSLNAVELIESDVKVSPVEQGAILPAVEEELLAPVAASSEATPRPI